MTVVEARPARSPRRRRRARPSLSLLLAAAAAAAAALVIAASDRAAAADAAAAPSPPTPTPGADERFTEELLLRPLPSGHLLALFHFESSAPSGRAHHVRFPRAAAQLLAAAPAARRVELSLAAGRWRPGEWGAAPFEAKPGGAELRAAFDVGAALEEEREREEEQAEEQGGGEPSLRRRRRRRGDDGEGEEDDEDEAPALRRAWGSLAHGLSGLLCASLNFVARPEATAREVDLLRHLSPVNATRGGQEEEDGGDEGKDGGGGEAGAPSSSWAWLRASLPREAVCTENLTPWLKLLPCRDGAGLAALLRARPAVFAAEYHALSVSLRADGGGRGGGDERIGGGGASGSDGGGNGRVVLAQRLALVLRPLAAPMGGAPAARPPPPPGRWSAWSLAATLAAEGALRGGGCPQASLSRVYVQEPPELAAAGEGGARMVLRPPPHGVLPAFRVSAAAVGLLPAVNGGGIVGGKKSAAPSSSSRVFWFDVDALAADADTDADVSLAWNPLPSPAAPAALQPRWTARAFTAGANMARGTLVLELERAAAAGGAAAAAATGGGKNGATRSASSSSSSSLPSAGNKEDVVCVSLVVPWFVRLWVHTLELSLDGARAGLDARTVARRAAPASARRAPLALDLCLDVPRGTRAARLTGAFSTGFMTVFEFPPDAHRGVDVPAARVTWLEKEGEGEEAAAAASSSSSSSPSSPSSSPLLAELARSRECAAYSDGVLVALAPPDFSMPYNVVCLTSTALAVFVGASVNAMLRRPARRKKGKAGKAAAARRQGKALLGADGDGGQEQDGDQGAAVEVEDADLDDDDDDGESSGSQEGEDEAAAAARAARRRKRRRKRAARLVACLLLFGGLALWIDPELRAGAAVLLPEEWRPKNSTEEARAAFAVVS